MTTAPKNLYQKLAAISGELGAIAKDGKAPEAMGGFKFISHGAVTAHLRQKLAERQVAILPTLELVSDTPFVMKTSKGERDARRIVVKLALDFVNGENAEERYRVEWFGEGIDTADKALQKAATSAQKYALMKAFLVSDKDDPDGQDSTGDEDKASSNGQAEERDSILDIPVAVREVLYDLGDKLPDKKTLATINSWLRLHPPEKVLASLRGLHKTQCGEECEHVRAQTAMPGVTG